MKKTDSTGSLAAQGVPTPSTPLLKFPTCPESDVSRRTMLKKLIAAGSMAIGSVAFSKWAMAEAVKEYKIDIINGPIPTPDQFLGPYYPVNKPTDGGEDMTQLPGRGKPLGQVIDVVGKIVNIHNEPCPKVNMEIWQPNAAGRYTHKNDHNPAPIDPNFDGYANIVSDDEGHYRFRTVRPGAYPVTSDFWRPPHIHFQLTGRVDRLITQMYFPNEKLNETDPILQVAWANDSLISKEIESPETEASDVTTMQWDIMLIEG